MGATSVAFFRNLNLGQGSSPTRTQLVEAFTRAGATSVLSFQVNGTVAFDAPSPQIGGEVVDRLTPVCGYADAVLVRPLAWLRDLELDGFPDGAEISLYDGPPVFPEPLPWLPPRGDLAVVRADALHAVSVNDLPGSSNATPVLERRLGVPVTSRGLPTVLRLLARLDRP
jgi:hypothetical protein